MIFDKHANLKYKYGNRHFWCRGYYVDTVQREYCELHLLTKGGTSNHEDRGKDASNSSTLALDAAGARREDWIGKERSKSHSPI